MATLADMKSRIADEIFREDLTSAIAREITSGISFYQRTRFWFNETRTITFDTVADRAFYTAADHADIPNLIEIDYIQISQSGWPYSLCEATPETVDVWSGMPSNGVPTTFSYFEQQLRLYPTPNGVYPMQIAALRRYPAPASDDEADNHWMTDAEELIRSRAKRNIYLHSLMDQGMAAVMRSAEDEALASLAAEASRRQNVHTLQPSGIF